MILLLIIITLISCIAVMFAEVELILFLEKYNYLAAYGLLFICVISLIYCMYISYN